MTKQLDGRLFMVLAENGGANLRANVKTVNELNVFPVPDGDTGTNMSMTLEQAVEAVKCEIDSVSKVSMALAKEMMFTARGNSGVILSQFFKGLAKGLDGLDKANAKDLANAFVKAAEASYMAVSQPVEGTILTVAREAAEFAVANIDKCDSLEDLFDVIIRKSQESLERTPELLPVLKQAGVVDSGGAGLLYIFEGMHKYFLGQTVGKNETFISFTKQESQKKPEVNADTVFEYGYCTEFILQLLNSKTSVEKFDMQEFGVFLNSVGDSVVSFKEGSVVKVHVHTKEPNVVIEKALKYGEFISFKLENMSLQHNETVIANNFRSSVEESKQDYAVVAVVTGDGMEELFREAGTSSIVYGGQTMNPSAKDFIDAFDKVSANNIIVFPNNKNVIMAAVQASEYYDKAKVYVIRTCSMCEGYAALVMADFTNPDCDEVIAGINEAKDNVITAEVTKAIRDAESDDVKVKKGDYISISGHKIVSSEADEADAVIIMLDRIISESEKDIVTVFTGKEATAEISKKIEDHLKNKHKEIDYCVRYGGQETYDYLISFE